MAPSLRTAGPHPPHRHPSESTFLPLSFLFFFPFFFFFSFNKHSRIGTHTDRLNLPRGPPSPRQFFLGFSHPPLIHEYNSKLPQEFLSPDFAFRLFSHHLPSYMVRDLDGRRARARTRPKPSGGNSFYHGFLFLFLLVPRKGGNARR